MRFLNLWRWILACCFIAAAPGHIRAQAAAGVDSGTSSQVSVQFARDMNLAQPANDTLPTEDKSSPENEMAAPSESSSINQNLPDAPSPHLSDAYVPLTDLERWHYFWKDTLLSPLAYIGAMGGAFGEQFAHQPRQWGNGFSGYVRRAGANVAQFGIQESIHQGGAALLHTDPRYLPCGCSGGIHRAWYALEMSFLTYKDNGKKTLDLSQLAGAYGGAIIVEKLYPSHYSPLVQGVQNGHIQVGANVMTNLFKEFTPELRHLNPFRRRAAIR